MIAANYSIQIRGLTIARLANRNEQINSSLLLAKLNGRQ